MNIKYENFLQFNSVLNSLLKTENEWKDLTNEKLKFFIYKNLRLILSQTQNIEIAPDLQKSLLGLSTKINEKFIQTSAHHLAYEIMGIALGLFSKENNKIDYLSQLPSEIRQKIYAKLIASNGDIFLDKDVSGFKSVRLVSKVIAEDTKIAWINNENVCLKSSGCKTVQDAIRYIKKNQSLYSANLLYFNLNDEDLKELQDCVWIQNLSISSDKITVEGLKFLKLLQLKSIEFHSKQLTDNALEYLKGMPLEKVNFSGCNQLTDKAFEYLKGMPLQTVDFSECYKLTDNALEYLEEMPLQNISLWNCYLFTHKALKKINQHFTSRGLELTIWV